MRWLVVLAIVAAAPAVAGPRPLPDLAVPRDARSPIVVIAPATARHPQPIADSVKRVALARRITAATGAARIAAYDELTASLELADGPDIDDLMIRARRHYVALLDEPALDSYPHAPELLVRAAQAIAIEGDALPIAERVIANYPKSPFANDARLVAARALEGQQRYPAAIAHLDALVASGPADFALYARYQRGWILWASGDHAAAVADLTQLATDPASKIAHEAAVDALIRPYSVVGRHDLAAALFDRIDGSQSAAWLRQLAGEYRDQRKHREAVAVLRAAIARDGDLSNQCRDRAAIVLSMIDAPNRLDAELAVTELGAAVAHGDSRCAAAADIAAGELAYAWHSTLTAKQSRAQVIRMWDRALELVTTPARRTVMQHNRGELTRRARGE